MVRYQTGFKYARHINLYYVAAYFPVTCVTEYQVVQTSLLILNKPPEQQRPALEVNLCPRGSRVSRLTKTTVFPLEQQVLHWHEEHDNNGATAITS